MLRTLTVLVLLEAEVVTVAVIGNEQTIKIDLCSRIEVEYANHGTMTGISHASPDMIKTNLMVVAISPTVIVTGVKDLGTMTQNIASDVDTMTEEWGEHPHDKDNLRMRMMIGDLKSLQLVQADSPVKPRDQKMISPGLEGHRGNATTEVQALMEAAVEAHPHQITNTELTVKIMTDPEVISDLVAIIVVATLMTAMEAHHVLNFLADAKEIFVMKVILDAAEDHHVVSVKNGHDISLQTKATTINTIA